METTIGSVLADAAARLAPASDTPELDARVLLLHCLHRDPAWLLCHSDDRWDGACGELFASHIERRRSGEPVAYITGSKEFWSLTLAVNDSVLIPRPETEHLVECALVHIPPGARWRIADLGTGSGAVALAIARERPSCRITATDISPAALKTAAANARRLGTRNVDFVEGYWCRALGQRRFHVVVSNPPYVAEGDRHLAPGGKLAFEPTLALNAGRDGLDGLSAIAADAAAHLQAPGWLLLEHGYDQEDAVAQILRAGGFAAIRCRRDYANLPRVTECQLPLTS